MTFKDLLEAGREANKCVSLEHEDRVLCTAPAWEKLGLAAGVFGPMDNGSKVVHSNRKFDVGFYPYEKRRLFFKEVTLLSLFVVLHYAVFRGSLHDR